MTLFQYIDSTVLLSS